MTKKYKKGGGRLRIESFGKQIKQLRIEKNLTQKELAKGVCSQAELSKIENGKIMPTIDLVQRLSQKLHISMVKSLSIQMK